ncbi:unnamed protein product [Spirodela intermedia]|uniref:Protein kinase domain-containing protein n=1 Tax=Spirodela intermedia TaxID=51605 RepID=A0A7I8JCX2_SPIIN|nr:unnamed protein product [Spirodela intermedia]CAA6667990.1 unnamed protein product [Spirodela intermedia]
MGAVVKSTVQPAAQRTQRDASYPLDARAYKLLHEIGSGVSAVVYKAACLPLDAAVVAIKAIDLERSRANLDNVRREAKAMALLSHPNPPLGVMPFMAAGSLHSIISSSFPDGLPEPSIAVVLRETLQVHALNSIVWCAGALVPPRPGHIHRDIKAGNILVDSDGSVKLADFGVSASIYESHASYSSSPPHLPASGRWRDALLDGTGGHPLPRRLRHQSRHLVLRITALELAHGRPPLSHLSPSKSLLMRVTSAFGSRTPLRTPRAREEEKKFSKAFKEMALRRKLLRHPFFKGCSPQPPREERPPCGGFDDSDEIYPLPPSSSRLRAGPGLPRRRKPENGEGQALCKTGDPPLRLSGSKESLVPSLVSLLGSLDFRGGWVAAEVAAEEKRGQQLAGSSNPWNRRTVSVMFVSSFRSISGYASTKLWLIACMSPKDTVFEVWL